MWSPNQNEISGTNLQNHCTPSHKNCSCLHSCSFVTSCLTFCPSTLVLSSKDKSLSYFSIICSRFSLCVILQMTQTICYLFFSNLFLLTWYSSRQCYSQLHDLMFSSSYIVFDYVWMCVNIHQYLSIHLWLYCIECYKEHSYTFIFLINAPCLIGGESLSFILFYHFWTFFLLWWGISIMLS